ncbi:DUF2130 domain-containing protein [Mycoplasma sp. P36-A1]|uniref:DUF2130 domain-containing protein n=1 Tax=Mycoplasma sp. P36-A1 TaxID=3252900 RepID=UPI003C2CDB48
MHEIKCPHCHKSFTIDEAGYADILAQVRTKEFSKEVEEKIKLLDQQHENEKELITEKAKNSLEQELAKKDKDLESLKSEILIKEKDSEAAVTNAKNEMNELINTKNNMIKELQTKAESYYEQKELEIKQAIIDKDKELVALNNKIDGLLNDNKLELEKNQSLNDKKIADKDILIVQLEAKAKQIESAKEAEKEKAVNSKNEEMEKLKNKINDIENNNKFELQNLQSSKEKEIIELKSELQLKDIKIELDKTALKEKYEMVINQKNEEVAFYKDFKAKQSTKMIGESLELHCENEFNSIRMSAFPNANFYKDNDVASGSKGDYIYRENDINGTEIISIMFEMKNEADDTSSKHKNQDFFKKLDKDRKDKKCEYAVLVSTLEADSDLYNKGIVDVSFEYDKMYVIRPQFFIPLITLLRNAAMRSLHYKNELDLIRQQNIDVTNFESDLNTFKSAFEKNYLSASNNFEKAIIDIDKSIASLEKVKKSLLTSENQLRLANNKAEDLTIKKLVKKNPTMKEKFDDLKNTVDVDLIETNKV